MIEHYYLGSKNKKVSRVKKVNKSCLGFSIVSELDQFIPIVEDIYYYVTISNARLSLEKKSYELELIDTLEFDIEYLSPFEKEVATKLLCSYIVNKAKQSGKTESIKFIDANQDINTEEKEEITEKVIRMRTIAC